MHTKKMICTDIQDADIEALHIGDMVYLTGTLITARDDVHHRLLKQGKALPVDLRRKAIFHAGPIMKPRKDAPDQYDVVSIGPTTSMRMEPLEYAFIPETGVKMIIGKGGMGPRTTEACQQHKAVHCVFPGGCAVLAASCVEQVERVAWLDLGMPEALWCLRVNAFGPLIVSIDCHGGNLFEQQRTLYRSLQTDIVKSICRTVDYLD